MVSGVSTDDPQRFPPLLSKCFMDSDTEKKTKLGLSLFTEQYTNIFGKFVHDVTLLVRQMPIISARLSHCSCRIPDLLLWSTLALMSDTVRQPDGVVINHLLRALETMRTLWRSQMGSADLYCSFLSFEITARLCLRCVAVRPIMSPSCQLCSRGVVKHRRGCHNCFRETEC